MYVTTCISVISLQYKQIYNRRQMHRPGVQTCSLFSPPSRRTWGSIEEAPLLKSLVAKLPLWSAPVSAKDTFWMTVLNKKEIPVNDNIRVVTSVIVPKYILPRWPGEVSKIWFSINYRFPYIFIFYICATKLLSLPPILNRYLGVEFGIFKDIICNSSFSS